jgi:hypothetical protein
MYREPTKIVNPKSKSVKVKDIGLFLERRIS